MPNIEFHGFSPADQRGIVLQIKEALKEKDFYNDVVITLYNDVVADFNEQLRPFIRICASEHEDEVLAALQSADVNVDIEIQPIKFFIPKT